MAVEATDTLVVGAGQSGIAMSEHLSALKIPHIVLERSRIAENWRSMRWDSLVANGPAWHDRFPNLTFEDVHPDAFPADDLILRRAASGDGTTLTGRQLAARAEAWRPWRGYAVMHLWRSSAAKESP